MDKIFSQEELYWLDDILPGAKISRIRDGSMSRNIHIAKVAPNGANDENLKVSESCFP